ncbi:MAG: autotransporter-associated beta strand repeat-containing protein [Verrucomicrobiota bacterium]
MKSKSAYRLVRSGSRNLAIALISLCAAHAAQGATIYWDGSATDWSAVGSWSSLVGATTPDPSAIPGASDIATFSISSITNTAQTVNLNGNQSVAGLSFLGTNTAATTLLGGGTARTLTLGSSGITIAAGAGAVTLGDGTAANNVLLSLASGAQAWTNSSANALTINNTAAAFTRVAGATLGFNKASTGNFLMSTTVLPNVNGIIGPWASFGTGSSTKYACNNAGSIAGLTGTTAPNAVALTDTSGTANYDLAIATGTVPANVSANTIRYTGAALTTGATSQTIPGNTGMVSFMVNGLMNAGTGLWTVGGTSAGQQLTIGANRELVVNTANNNITVAAVIANNPFGASSLTVTGGNTLTLSSASSTYTGKTVINGGTLAVGTGDTTTAGAAAILGVYPSSFQADNITINNGATLYNSGNGTIIAQPYRGIYVGAGSSTIMTAGGKSNAYASVISGPGNVLWNGGGSSTRPTILAQMTYTGTTTLNIGNGNFYFGNGGATAANIIQDGSFLNSPSLSLTGYAQWQNVGSTTYAGVISGSGNGGQVGGTPGSILNNAAVVLSDGFSNSVGITAGRGILTLSGANTYTQGTVLYEGGITLAGSGTLGVNANNLFICYGALNLGGKSITQSAVYLQDGTLTNGTLTSTGGYNLMAAASGNGGFVASANLAGSTTLAKAGAGMATLSGANTYTGATTLTLGSLVLGSAENGPTSGPLGVPATLANSLVMNGGYLEYSSANQYDYSSRFSSASTAYNANTNGQTVIWGTNLTNSAATLAETGAGGTFAISGGLLTQNVGGTLTLSGTNSFTGATTVSSGGTLSLTGSDSASSALVLGGGTVSYAPTVGSSTQTVNGLTLNAGASAINATATNTVALGALTARNAGGTVDFGTTGTITTSASNGSGNILGGYATVGAASYAYVSGGTILPFSGYNNTNSTNDTVTTNNDNQTAGVTLAGNMTVNSLTISDTGANALALGTNTLTFSGSNGGVLYTGGGTYSVTGTGLIGAGTTSEFIVNVGNGGSLTINNPIVSTTATAGSLTKTGSGALTIASTATNPYTGGTYVDAGTLTVNSYASNTTGLGTGNVAIAAGATLNIRSNAQSPTLANTFAGAGTLGLVFTAANTITTATAKVSGLTGIINTSNTGTAVGVWSTSGTLYAGVNLGAYTTLNASAAAFFPNGITISGGDNTYDSIKYITTFTSNVTLNTSATVAYQSNNLIGIFAGNITSGAASGTQTLYLYDGSDFRKGDTFTGNISNGTTGGTIGITSNKGQNDHLAVLSGNNTYTGPTTVNFGILRAVDGVSLPSNSNLNITGRSIFETSANLIRPAGNGAGQMQLTTGPNPNDSGFNAVINPVTVGFGTSTSDASATILTWGSGSFVPSNNTLDLNKTWANVGSYTATIGSNITFVNPIILGTTACQILTDYGVATMSGALTGTTATLTKINTGTLVLSGNNTYNGATTVNAGTLILSGDNSGSASAVTVASGAIGQFNSLLSIPSTGRTVTDTGKVVFGPDFGAGNIAAGLARVTTTSAGAVAADNYLGTNFDFNTAGLTAASLGVITSSTYTGTYTPNATAGYKLGGGGGTLTLSGTNALTGANAASVTGNVVLTGANDVSGITTLNASSTLTLGTGYAGQTGSVGGNIANNGTSLTFNNFDNLTYNGAISGAGALNKLGVGTLTLGGTNTLTGAITVTGGGTLVLSGNNSGSTSAVQIGAASNFTTQETLTVTGGLNSLPTGILTLSAATLLNLRSDSATDYSARTWQLGNGNDTAATVNVDQLTSSGSNNQLYMGPVTVGNGRRLVVSGGNGYSLRIKSFATQNGPGTIIPTTTSVAIDTVTNAAGTSTLYLDGTHTGDNTVGAITGTTGEGVSKANIGTWRLTGTNTYSNATSVYGGGTLILDYSGTGTDTSKFSDSTALTLGSAAAVNATATPSGGTLTLKGGTHLEVVGSTTLTTGGTWLTRSGGGSSTLQMQVLTRAAGGTIDFADATIATVSLANANNIIGGYATLGGTDWATGGLGNTPVTAYSGYTTGLASGLNPTLNYALSGIGSLSATTTANTLKIANSANGDSLALGTNPLTFTYTSAAVLGGLLYVGGNDNLYTISGSGAGIIGAGAANEFIVNTNTGALTLDAPIIGNGAGSLTKTGAGTLVLNQASSYTGITRVHQGVLRLMNATSSGTAAGGINVQNGAAVELANNITVGAEAINSLVGTGVSNGGALRNIASNSSTYGGAIAIGEGGARINSDSGGALTLTGGVVTGSSGGVVSGSAFSSTADLTIGGAGGTTVSTAAISGYGKVIKDSAGTLTLSFANTYTGATAISGGTLVLSGSGSINTSKGISINGSGAQFLTSSSTAVVAPITLTQGTIGGSGTISTAVTIGANGILSPGNSPGSQSYTSGITWAGGGSYLWQVDQVDTANVAQTAYKGLDAGFDWLNVSGTLAISATPSSKFTLDVNGLLHSTHALGAVGSWDSSKNYDWVIASATSAISGFDAAAFTLSTTNFASGGNSLGAGSFSLTQSSNDIVLHFAGSAITATNGQYQLTSTANGASTATLIVGGSVGVSTILLNTGTGLQDALNVSGVAPIASGGTVTPGTAGSNSNLALSGTATATGYTFSAGTAGSYTISAASPTVANVTAGGTPTPDAPVTASVTVYDHASPGFTPATLALGNIHAGYSGPLGSSNNINVSNGTPGDNRVALKGAGTGTHNVSLTPLTGLLNNGSATPLSASLAGGTTGGTLLDQSITYTFADDSSLSGHNASLYTPSIAITGQVYSGDMVWSGASGNWSGDSNWNDALSASVHVAPGLDGGFTGVDSATFATAGSHTVTVDVAANIHTLNLSTGDYTLSGSSSLSLAGASAKISSAGTQAISAPVILANNAEVAVSSGTLTVSGGINESSSGMTLLKSGGGILALSGSSNYSGLTTVDNGTLLVNSSLPGAVAVTTGATLGGSGSIAGAVNVTGIPKPGGDSLESLASGPLTLNGGSSLVMGTLYSTPAVADLMVVTGALTLTSPTLTLSGLDGAWATGSRLTLLSYTGSLTGTFSGYADDTSYLFGSNYWMINYNAPLADKGSNFVGDLPGTGAQLVTVTLDAYKTWASGAAFNADSNNDGVANGLAWILGATTPSANSNALLPTASASASGGLTLTFKRLEASITQSTLVLEYSTSLTSNSWTPVTIGAASSSSDSVDVTVTPASPSDTVSVHIPASKAPGGKVFARLKATQP